MGDMLQPSPVENCYMSRGHSMTHLADTDYGLLCSTSRPKSITVRKLAVKMELDIYLNVLQDEWGKVLNYPNKSSFVM